MASVTIRESELEEIQEIDPYIGKTLNKRYLVERVLGSGAFGKVYLVTADESE